MLLGVTNFLQEQLEKAWKTDKKITQYFGPHERARLLSKYRESMAVESKITTTEAFKIYTSQRLQNMKAFNAITNTEGDTLRDIIAEGREAKERDIEAVTNSINNALKLTPATQYAQKKFDRKMQALTALGQTNPPSLSLLADSLQSTKEKLNEAIEEQHIAEEKALSSLFTKSEFVGSLYNILNLEAEDKAPNPQHPEILNIKNQMLSKLNESQSKELAQINPKTQKLEDSAIEQALNAKIKELRKSEQLEMDRISYIASMYEKNKDMRKAIDALIKKRRRPNSSTGIATVDFDEGYAKFKDIEVKDIPIIQAITNKGISYDAATKTARATLSKWGLWDRSFLNRHKSEEYVLTSMAMTIKACGHKGITLNVKHADPEYAQKLGRAAYKAAIEAGFSPKDINIKVNNELVSDEYDAKGELKQNGKLFEHRSTEYQKLIRKAGEIEKERKEAISPVETADAKRKFKLALKEQKALLPPLHPPPEPDEDPVRAPDPS